jgi:hypothetical protein
MAKEKLKIEHLKIESFVTSIDKKETQTIIGGVDNVDTSRIDHCTPHGSIANCPDSVVLCVPQITGKSYGPTFCGGWRCWIADNL